MHCLQYIDHLSWAAPVQVVDVQYDPVDRAARRLAGTVAVPVSEQFYQALEVFADCRDEAKLLRV